MASSEQTPAFLRLPYELREQIYTELFVLHIPLNVRGRFARRETWVSYDVDTFPYPVHVAFLRTCRRVRDEATPILYGRNTFTAHPTVLANLPCFLVPDRQVIYPSLISLIRRWYVGVGQVYRPAFTREAAARAFTGAESLEIEVYQPMVISSKALRDMLERFEGIRCVRRVRVIVQAAPEESASYVRWLEEAIRAEIGAKVEAYQAIEDGSGEQSST